MLRIFIFLCLFCVREEPVLTWSEEYKLNWSDFKGQSKELGDAVAVTASGITFGFSIKERGAKVIGFTTTVESLFYPEQSWYKPEKANNHVLAHEQLHFDITELYARKFRKRISELIVSNSIKKQLKDLHESILKELAKTQDLYDSETNFSRNEGSQLKWQNFIASELEKLANFKSDNSQ